MSESFRVPIPGIMTSTTMKPMMQLVRSGPTYEWDAWLSTLSEKESTLKRRIMDKLYEGPRSDYVETK